MRIGLISDTHIPFEEKDLPRQVLEAFQGVDLILHAGDIYAHSVLDELERVAPVLAALGDDDFPSPDPRVQARHILILEGQTLWLIHEGPPTTMSPEWLTLWWQKRIPQEDNKYGKPDIIVFGHEHQTFVERYGNILLINPGSPTFLDYKRGLGTVGILEINSGRTDVYIKQLQKSTLSVRKEP